MRRQFTYSSQSPADRSVSPSETISGPSSTSPSPSACHTHTHTHTHTPCSPAAQQRINPRKLKSHGNSFLVRIIVTSSPTRPTRRYPRDDPLARILTRMSRGCCEETGPVEFQLLRSRINLPSVHHLSTSSIFFYYLFKDKGPEGH